MELLHFIALLERIIGREAQKNLLPMQRGDVLDNSADVADLERDVDFAPAIPLEQGLARFVEWYRDYYGV